MRDTFLELLSRAGITDCRFHDLRHTFAAHMVMASVDLFTVGKLFGHRGTTMTQRYSHLSPWHLHKAVNNLPDWEAGSQKMDRKEGVA